MDCKDLESHLVKRESRESLVKRGILRASNMDSFVAAQISHLQRLQKSDIMNAKLRSRPNIDVLVKKNIIRDFDLFITNNNNNGNNNCFKNYINPNEAINENDTYYDQQNNLNFKNLPLHTLSNNRNNIIQNNYSDSSNDSGNDIVLDPTQKQQIQYMLTDHLVTRPSPIDLLNCQILCPDLQYKNELDNNKLGNSSLNSIYSYFDNLSKEKSKSNNTFKKAKKYSFHEVTPDQIKKNHVNNINGNSARYDVISDSIHHEQSTDVHSSNVRNHYKRLIEQQTIYLNYEVARRNALISQLKREQDELNNLKCKLEQHHLHKQHINGHNLHQNINFPNNSPNTVNNTTNIALFGDNFNCSSQPNNMIRDLYGKNTVYDKALNDTSSIQSNNLQHQKSPNYTNYNQNNDIMSSSYCVDDYLRKFDINVPNQRRFTDPFHGCENSFFTQNDINSNMFTHQSDYSTTPPTSNYSIQHCNNPSFRDNSIAHFNHNNTLFNSFSDITFDNNHQNLSSNNSIMDSSTYTTRSNNSDIYNNNVYNMTNYSNNSNDFQPLQNYTTKNYDNSLDYNSTSGVSQMDFNSLVSFYEFLIDLSRNSKP